MSESFLSGRISLHCGDSLEILRNVADASVDSVCTDPPYALVSIVKRFGKPGSAPAKGDVYARASSGFMGKSWDTGERAFAVDFWSEVNRVLKPGGHVVAFGGTRTYHRLVCAIEDAGFEVRDQIGWVFGSGFPKSLNIGGGLGTALKPAWEPIVLARKPLHGTVAVNVLAHGTGALNIDGCRISIASDDLAARQGRSGKSTDNNVLGVGLGGSRSGTWSPTVTGRWPANLIHDGSDEVMAAFPETSSGVLKAGTIRNAENKIYGKGMAAAGVAATLYDTGGDSGSAARFFYSAKADADDRLGSKHPTVKPVDLMQYLVRLVTPPGGIVLDPFAGTGTTGEAAWREGMRAILCEREPEYQADIRRRMALCLAGPDERRRAVIKAKAKPDDLSGTLFAPVAPMAAE